MLKYLVSLFITLILVGCSGVGSQPTAPKSNGSLPKWVLNPTNSNAIFYYAVGEGSSTTEAKNNALKQVSAEISVTISSSTTSKKYTTLTTYQKNIENITKASTQKIQFTGVSVVDTVFVNGVFYSYIKVNRDVLFQSQLKQMNLEYNKVLSISNKFDTNGIFYIFKESQNLNTSIDKTMVSLPILKSINNKFNDNKYTVNLLSIKEKATQLKAQAVVYLKTTNAFNEKIVLEKAISDFGIKIIKNISNVQNKNNLMIITIDKSAKPYENRYKSQKMKNVSFADIRLKIITYDKTGKTKLAQNIINVRNASRDGYEAAVVKTKKLEKEIDKKGILNILLETI